MGDVENNDKMTSIKQNPLHTRRRCFRFSYTAILYIISILIQFSLCSARPNQDNGGKENEETGTGVIKATRELPSSSTTELNPKSEESDEKMQVENERSVKNAEDSKSIYPATNENVEPDTDENSETDIDCSDEDTDDEICDLTTEKPNLHHPFNAYIEPKMEFATDTWTIQPQSTTQDQGTTDKLPSDSMTSTTRAQSTTNEKEYLDSIISTTEKFRFTTVFTVSIGDDYNERKNVKIKHSKGSIPTNCNFILFTIPILLYFL